MTQKIEVLNNTNKNDEPNDNNNDTNNSNNNSLKFNIPIKNLLFIFGTIILLLSSFFVSAIIASNNYEEIFRFIKTNIF
ncbi:hypothetical protein GOQ27_01285 [Clostridium sp. D2Q-11]|uniref:Uncharacterized protein n=1 Tax=Anaeromonas frigoriresistens TaxID=2683708 RepID=A0A942UR69_9FIRM|nr:hypothetical protein [Anaeromonas frigoriresistens]MBS4537073.1 hypothetical protein [Anaeromonas frigoriresistens]